MKLIRKLLWFIFLIIVGFSLVCLGYYFAVTKDAVLSPQKLALSDKTFTLYDMSGANVDNAGLTFTQSVKLSEIPKETQIAFVGVEDKRFYSHNGFDLKRIVKATINNLRSRSFKEGASTISQQLIKNTHLSQEKTLSRKLREWKLTRALEREYTKDQILEKYLNVIYFGHNCFGLQSAARFYFDKQPSELDLADSAILAGLVRSPNNYSPFKNPEKCAKRKESVLRLLFNNGAITKEQLQRALETPLPLSPHKNSKDFGYLHFVFDELSALSEQHGFTISGKVEIDTYLDPAAQKALEAVALDYTQSDKTFIVLDNRTHGFKACVSSVGGIRRLTGSLLKPLLVYAPALEENLISPATPILDEKINFSGYSPNNFDGKFHGYVSARECLANSLNVPAVKLLNSLGTEKGAAYLEKLNLPIENGDLSLALALGGMKNGYTFRDLIAAYAAFPNGGTFSTCGFISAVRIDGKTVYKHIFNEKRVFSEETAYLTTDILRTAAQTGTAKKLRSLPFQIAAKTGTAGTEKGNTDAYALSYTTRDTVGVWLGNATGELIEHTGGGLPCNFLLTINERLSKLYSTPIENFAKPKDVTSVTLDKISYYDTHTLCLADKLAPEEYTFQELFKKSAIPLKISDLFSNPTILPPDLVYENGKVVITFHDRLSKLYRYKIERYDYATHSTLYVGEYLETFIDDNVLENKNYVYFVTPIYQGKQGKRIVLPTVSTKAGELPWGIDKEILEKDWWDY